MTKFDTRSFANEKRNSSSNRANETWQLIRQSSVLAFSERTARLIGAPRDKALLRVLTEMALTNGAAEFVYAGHKYTGQLVLKIYSQGREPDGNEPFAKRAQWDEFSEAMRKLRDPDVPMYGREHLLKIGVRIEERQRPHAQGQGWTA